MRTKRKRVAVIGGGAGGCGASLALAENGWKVSLFEKRTLFSGTSGMAAGRLHLGFHYKHLKTSLMLLRTSVRLTKAFPGVRVAESLPLTHSLRRGRFFVTKDSLASAGELLKYYECMKQLYKDMIKEDPSNEVFGPPEDFYRVMDEKEYANDVDTDRVVLGIETAEHLIDRRKFQETVRWRLRNHRNVTIYQYTELIDVRKASGGEKARYILYFLSEGKRTTRLYDYVVNSTWCQIEHFNRFLGFPRQSIPMTIRLKAILQVALPPSMYETHSMLFCVGPFCMFSNLGDGTGLITYAPVTNVASSDEMTEKMTTLVTRGAINDEFRRLSDGILQGASGFIAGLRNARIIDLSFGIVMTRGSVNIYDKNSPVHERSYFDVRSEGDGWISNPCMKLVNLLENADIVVDLLEKQFHLDTVG